MSFGSDMPDIAPAGLPKRSGREPFGLVEFPLAGLLAVIAWLEGEGVRIGRARRAEARSGVAVGARTDAGLARTLALVKRLVRVDALYRKLVAWNRVVRAKRAVLEDAAARVELLESLGGLEACERWERRAAGLRRRRERTPDWYRTFRARERAEARNDGVDGSSPGASRERDLFTLPSLPSASDTRYASRGGSREARNGDAPIPVWPCELLDADVHAAMLERVREAVREKDADLAAQRAAGVRVPGRDVPVRGVRPAERDTDPRRAGWKPP